MDTAFCLFNEYGYHVTGIDRILSESGVSKATLYKHFRSKEELIIAVLQQRHDQVTAGLVKTLEASQQSPKVLAVFDMLDTWFKSENFFGCNFIHANAEFAQENSEIKILVMLHKNRLINILKETLPKFNHAKELAEKLLLLMDGAIVQAHLRQDLHAAKTAKKIARVMLLGAAK